MPFEKVRLFKNVLYDWLLRLRLIFNLLRIGYRVPMVTINGSTYCIVYRERHRVYHSHGVLKRNY